MPNIALLDCTLRDGGFVNDWNFGKSSIVNIFVNLIKAKVDYLELGYIRNHVAYVTDCTEFSTTKDAEWLVAIRETIATSKTRISLMLDYGQCDIDNICQKTKHGVDYIRVTFKKKDIDEALLFCRNVQNKGYPVFAQPVSITDYADSEVLCLVEKLNALKPACVSIVDTYGFMQKSDLIHVYSLMDHNLADGIMIGYHAHNNLQLGFSNSVALFEYNTIRHTIIDTSLYGMGKSAGNTCTELLMHYVNSYSQGRYNKEIAMEMIDTEISKYQVNSKWGYDVGYYLAAVYRCHPKYVFALTSLKSLSMHSIASLLENIPQDKKTNYDESYLRDAYLSYQLSGSWDDTASYRSLKRIVADRPILVIGLGSSTTKYKEVLHEFIYENHPFIIGVNGMLNSLKYDAIFFNNEKRYLQYQSRLEGADREAIKLVTSNIMSKANDDVLHFCVRNVVGLIAELDNSTIVLLNILLHGNMKSVFLAGIDGFSMHDENFTQEFHSMGKQNIDFSEINRRTQNCFDALCSQGMHFTSITPSFFYHFEGHELD
jgi:4-hydroxy 2-oxovalerate aldolase